MKVGDLVKVAAEGLRTPIGSLALITRVEERQDSRGIITQYWANMVESGSTFWFRLEALEIISENR
jgi:hypothetical protein